MHTELIVPKGGRASWQGGPPGWAAAPSAAPKLLIVGEIEKEKKTKPDASLNILAFIEFHPKHDYSAPLLPACPALHFPTLQVGSRTEEASPPSGSPSPPSSPSIASQGATFLAVATSSPMPGSQSDDPSPAPSLRFAQGPWPLPGPEGLSGTNEAPAVELWRKGDS